MPKFKNIFDRLTGLLAISLLTAALALTPLKTLADTRPHTGTPATVSADALPTVQINGVVWKQVTVGNVVYATGSFTKARPAGSAVGVNEVTRSNLLAYDITTGNLLPFNHSLNAQGRAIAVSPDLTKLYVGGDFTTVDGQAHPHLAAFSLPGGTLVSSFTGGTSSTVKAIAARNNMVYVGGGFVSAMGKTRNHLAAFTPAGVITGWGPSADSSVDAMVMSPDQTKVIFGGNFGHVNGSVYHGLGAADAMYGVPLPWASQSDSFPIRDDNINAGITSLSANSDTVFLTSFNYLDASRPGGFEGRAAIRPSDGSLIWANDCHGDSYSAYPIGNVLYSASHAHDCAPMGAFPESNPRTWHRGLAETTYATHTNGPATNGYNSFQGIPAGTQLDWYPNFNVGTYTGQYQGPWSVTGNAQYVSFGGEFTKVNGKNQQGLVRFAISSLAPNKVGPTAYTGFGLTTGPANANGVTIISWNTTFDIDNADLLYKLYRDGTVLVCQGVKTSTFWSMSGTGCFDTGLVPGSVHTYKVVVTDAFNNATSTTNR